MISAESFLVGSVQFSGGSGRLAIGGFLIEEYERRRFIPCGIGSSAGAGSEVAETRFLAFCGRSHRYDFCSIVGG